jgi:hypothetical protein
VSAVLATACRALSVAQLSSALGDVPVIEGAVTHCAGTVVHVSVEQLATYRPLMVAGSLAIVDAVEQLALIRLGPTETWLMVAADAPPSPAGDAAELVIDDHYVIDWDRAARVAARIAQTTGFAVVARKPGMREDFARPIVEDWYAPDATEWHVAEIAARARNLWEFGVLPRDAKAMDAAGVPLAAIATALGVSKNRAKWAIELPEEHSIVAQLGGEPTVDPFAIKGLEHAEKNFG